MLGTLSEFQLVADCRVRQRKLGEGELMDSWLKPKDGVIKIYKVAAESFKELLNYYPKYKKQI